METDTDTRLPGITQIDTDALEAVDSPGVRIWFESGAKIQVVEDDEGSIERQWFGSDHLGHPEETQIVDEATRPGASLAEVGLQTVADYLAFDDEADARATWGDEYIDVLLGERAG